MIENLMLGSSFHGSFVPCAFTCVAAYFTTRVAIGVTQTGVSHDILGNITGSDNGLCLISRHTDTATGDERVITCRDRSESIRVYS